MGNSSYGILNKVKRQGHELGEQGGKKVYLTLLLA